MNELIPFQGGLLAIGWERVGFGDGSHIAMWTSDDGIAWTFVPTRGTSIDTYHLPIDAAIAPDGQLVLAAMNGLGTGTVIWTTPDGETWTEHGFTADGDFVTASALAASSSLMVAVGESGAIEPTGGAAAWISDDGRTWARVRAPTEASELEDVTYDAARGQFVAVGQRGDGRPGAWLTSDGRSWRSSPLADVEGKARAVSASEGLVVAVGSLTASPSAHGMAWSSFDGITWFIAPFDDSERVAPVTVGVNPRGAAVGSGEILESTTTRLFLGESGVGP